MLEWIQHHENIVWWLVASSVFTFVASALVVPWMIVRIPPDYFTPSAVHGHPFSDRHPVIRSVGVIAKNLLGVVLLVVGVLMLVLPGQGILTILAGIVLLDFPGRRRTLEWIVARHAVLKSLNWIRRRAGRDPLVIEG